MITATDVRRAAMDLLARREHGAAELITKLQKRFAKARRRRGEEGEESPDPSVLEALIQDQVAKLTLGGLQSDLRLAESFLRSRVNRGQGPIKIRMELRQKGVADSIVESVMSEAEVDWQAVALEVAERKFARVSTDDLKVRAKRQRFLQQRGFSFEHISAVERN